MDHGNHNGMKSVVTNLSSEEFSRIRVGIGKPNKEDNMIDYVIKAMNEEEKSNLNEPIKRAAQATIEIIKNGIDIAMNKFN